MATGELIIVSTTLVETSPNTAKLLNEIATGSMCGEGNEFGNNFYPIIGLKSDGNIQYVCSKENLSDELILCIVRDDKEFKDDFNSYLKKRIATIDCLYVILHEGKGSIHDTHQNKILEITDSNQEKIRIAKEHHTSGYSLGDGLEKVAEAVMCKPVKFKLLEEGINYLKIRPIYHNPLKEAYCRIWKEMRLTALRIRNGKDASKEKVFAEAKNKLEKDEKIRQINEEFSSWSLNNLDEKMKSLLATFNSYK